MPLPIRTRQLTGIAGLLPQTLRLGHAEGLLDVSVTAGGVTEAEANAAMGATTDETGLWPRSSSWSNILAAT